FTPTFADFLLVAFHGESRNRDYGDHPQLLVLLEPFCDLQSGHFGKLNVHEDEIGAMLAGQRDRFAAIPRLQCFVSLRHENIVKQLQIENIVLDDQDFASHRPAAVRVRLASSWRHVTAASRNVPNGKPGAAARSRTDPPSPALRIRNARGEAAFLSGRLDMT